LYEVLIGQKRFAITVKFFNSSKSGLVLEVDFY